MINNNTKLYDSEKASLPKDWLDSPFSNYLNIRYRADIDDSNFWLDFDEKYIGNPSLKAFHGGIVAIFIETVAQIYFAQKKASTRLQSPETVTVDYLRPALSSSLLAIPEVIRLGRNFSTIGVTVTQNKKIVSKGRIIFAN